MRSELSGINFEIKKFSDEPQLEALVLSKATHSNEVPLLDDWLVNSLVSHLSHPLGIELSSIHFMRDDDFVADRPHSILEKKGATAC
jgi:hypothetical protein